MRVNSGSSDAVKVRELMTSSNLVTVNAEDELSTAERMMDQAGVRRLPVLSRRRVVGVLTDQDVRKTLRKSGTDASTVLRVEDAMARPPRVAHAEEPAAEAARAMARDEFGCLPVVEGEDLVGIITRSDLLQVMERGTGTLAAPGTPAVAEVMTREVATVAGDAELVAAAERMLRLGLEHLPVVDRNYRVLGMLAARDVREAFARRREVLMDQQRRPRIRDLRVWAAMSTPAVSVREETPVEDALGYIVGRRIGALPVVDENDTLVGLVADVNLLEPPRRQARSTFRI